MKSSRKIRITKRWEEVFQGFTLVELIVVITILAILATVGFLSLSGYSDDARTATVKTNVRTVYSAILTESTTSGNSPRYYVDHATGAALSGAVAFSEGNPVVLTGGQFGDPGTNYSAGNPRWDRLRMNGDKFRMADALRHFYSFGTFGTETSAAYSTGELAVGAVDVFKVGANGRKRNVPIFQVAAVEPRSNFLVITGNYALGTGAEAGVPSLIRDASSASPSAPLTEPRTSVVIVGDEITGRKWSDGTVASSCLGYASPAAGKAYAGSVGNGTYVIDPDGSGSFSELKVYCDMTADGGGYTLYPIENGLLTRQYTDNDSCKALGLNMVIPRTKAHWLAMVTKYDGSYFATIPGIYNTFSSKYYGNCVMRDPNAYGSGCPDWRALDGGRWWIRDTPYGEPNGDYHAGTWLGTYPPVNASTINAGQPFNDVYNWGYSTTKYICSTNDKP